MERDTPVMDWPGPPPPALYYHNGPSTECPPDQVQCRSREATAPRAQPSGQDSRENDTSYYRVLQDTKSRLL